MSVAEVSGQALVVLGGLLIVIASVGLFRLPDLFTRTNAVAKAAALGVSCALAGTIILIPSPVTIVVGLLAIAAQLFTAPIAGYAVGRAGYRAGAPLAKATLRDDLANHLRHRE